MTVEHGLRKTIKLSKQWGALQILTGIVDRMTRAVQGHVLYILYFVATHPFIPAATRRTFCKGFLNKTSSLHSQRISCRIFLRAFSVSFLGLFLTLSGFKPFSMISSMS